MSVREHLPRLNVDNEVFAVDGKLPDECVISIQTTFKALRNIKPNKALGPDNTPAWVLKDHADLLVPPLTANFNCSLREGKLPKEWKMANIISLPKSIHQLQCFRMSSSTKKSVQLAFFKTSRRAMAPNRRQVIGSRHLVCGNCASWIQHENSGCENKRADTRVEGFVFTCRGCTEVAALAKEMEGMRQMVEDMKEMVAGLRFEDKGAETGSRVTTTGVNQDREEAAGNIMTEKMITSVEDELGAIRTEARKEICAGATLMATHTYTRNPESPLGKEIDLRQWDTLIFKGEDAENEHWRLVEDRHGQVGYAPAAFLVITIDTTAEEEESDATKKGQENSTEENQTVGWIGQEGERRKSYSAAVIDGIERNSRIYVGDSIVRKTDTRFSKGEEVVVCLPGAIIEHVTERVEEIMGR